jgi:hypothetical protein
MKSADSENSDVEKVGLGLALFPGGSLHLDPEPPDGGKVPKAVARRIEAAFERGPGPGLVHLGAREVASELPPSLAFGRELGRLYVTKLCGVPDLEAHRAKLHLEAPAAELLALVGAAPPMRGAEYLSVEVLDRLWEEIEAALREEIAGYQGTVQELLRTWSPLGNLVGRVYFHLAENKRSPETPFAFLATYTTRLSQGAKVQHLPLGQALKEYAGARNRAALLSLLSPIQKAAGASALLKELVDSGEIFHPLAWTPREAYRFLTDIPAFEAAGVLVRVPDWWHARRPPRPQVRVTVGEGALGKLGTSALLDFSVEATLNGEPLSEAEWEQILAASEGLALIRGQWVEVDREKLKQVLAHWKAVKERVTRDGLSFVEAMRLLSGASIEGSRANALEGTAAEWSTVRAGAWLSRALEGLRRPEGLEGADPGEALRGELRPYQKVGLHWLWWLRSLGLGACLADDMGLGKTLQVLALLLVMKRDPQAGPSLLVAPASLLANWKAEIARFAPSLRTLIAHPSAMPAAELARLSPKRLRGVDLVMTTYASLWRMEWPAQVAWDLVVLDEAQAVKNPAAKQTRAVKTLNARARLALTGTPVENRLADLWSIFDFLAPGLLGSAEAFGRFVKRLAQAERPDYGPLRDLVRPYILRRLKTDPKVISDLPEKVEVRAYCGLTKKQAVLYQQAVDALRRDLEAAEGMKRRGTILATLTRLKQLCNHPSQWPGDGAYEPAQSGKFLRLAEICEEIASRQEKALIFTQFREMTGPLATFLQGIFGRSGLVLHGETEVGKRRGLVEEFQREGGPPFFVLSLKAGGTGLNLTAASHVIHFDRWWNPAVEDQATDRAFRIGQKKNVLVHKFVCRGTVEERIDGLIESKRALSAEILKGSGEALLTELSNEEILRLVSLDLASAIED